MGAGVDGFWGRLKQSKLVQWALAYIAAAFAFVQGLDVIAQRFGWPERIEKVIILALAVGFLVALVLAWYHGERGAQRVGGSELLIIALLLAIGGGVLWAYARSPATPVVVVAKPATPASAASVQVAARAFDPPADTLVVLPFANLGGDPKQQYFSDGITEELTNALGQNTTLRVIAWDTASKFRDSRQPATDIAKTLNVANVLTGKILRQGSEVRVIVELVNARTGYQAWSSHYDDSLANIFQVQDKISASIASALKVKFASTRAAPTVDPQAHDLVLKGAALMRTDRTAAGLQQARRYFEQAIALDPGYADAHAWVAGAWFDLTQFSPLPLAKALPQVRAEAGKALALDPDNVYALIVLANIDATEGRIDKAKAGYERALKLDPSNAIAHLDYALMLPLRQSLAESLEAVRLDPERVAAQNNLALAYLDLGEYQGALPAAQGMMRLEPDSPDSAFLLASNYALLHRIEDAVKVFDQAKPQTSLAKQLIAAGRLAYQSVLDPKLRPQALAAANALRRRNDLDPVTVADLTQIYSRLGEYTAMLDLLPGMCTASPASCSDLSVNPVFLPVHGNPAFEALVKKYDTTSQPAAALTSSSP